MVGSGPHLIMISWARPSPNPKRYLDRFSLFAQMTAECSYTYNVPPIPPQNLPFLWVDVDPSLIHGSLG